MTPEYFTIVFDGRLRDIKSNPFKIESPFGKVVAVSVGDELDKRSIREELLAALIEARDQTNMIQHSQETRLNDIYDILSAAIAKATGAVGDRDTRAASTTSA